MAEYVLLRVAPGTHIASLLPGRLVPETVIEACHSFTTILMPTSDQMHSVDALHFGAEIHVGRNPDLIEPNLVIDHKYVSSEHFALSLAQNNKASETAGQGITDFPAMLRLKQVGRNPTLVEGKIIKKGHCHTWAGSSMNEVIGTPPSPGVAAALFKTRFTKAHILIARITFPEEFHAEIPSFLVTLSFSESDALALGRAKGFFPDDSGVSHGETVLVDLDGELEEDLDDIDESPPPAVNRQRISRGSPPLTNSFGAERLQKGLFMTGKHTVTENALKLQSQTDNGNDDDDDESPPTKRQARLHSANSANNPHENSDTSDIDESPPLPQNPLFQKKQPEWRVRLPQSPSEDSHDENEVIATDFKRRLTERKAQDSGIQSPKKELKETGGKDDIPFLQRPTLIEALKAPTPKKVQSPKEMGKGKQSGSSARWEWKSRVSHDDQDPRAWSTYSPGDTSALETAFRAKKTGVNPGELSNKAYGVVFCDGDVGMVQYRGDDPSRWRAVRRVSSSGRDVDRSGVNKIWVVNPENDPQKRKPKKKKRDGRLDVEGSLGGSSSEEDDDSSMASFITSDDDSDDSSSSDVSSSEPSSDSSESVKRKKRRQPVLKKPAPKKPGKKPSPQKRGEAPPAAGSAVIL